MGNQNSKPRLFEYLNVIAYLRDCYEFRKSCDPAFSYERWARDLGLESKSYLRMVLQQQRRITPSFEAMLVRSERFNAIESEYFHFLVQYSQAKNHREKTAYGKSLTQILTRVSGQVEIEQHYEFLSDHLLPKLLTLLSFEDLERSADALAPILRTKPSVVRDALGKLDSLGLVERKDGPSKKACWHSKNKRFKVPQRLGDLAISSFHKASLREAISQLDTVTEFRRYRSLLLPLNADELAEVYGALEAFAAELISKYGADSYDRRRVYQLNLNIYPITELAEAPVPRSTETVQKIIQKSLS